MDNAEHAGQSLLNWVFTSLGPMYTILLPLSAIISFVLVLILVFRGNGPMAAVAIVLALSAPTLIGILAYAHGTMISYYAIANGGGTPDPSKLAEAISVAMIAPLTGMFLSIPTYTIAIIGTLLRSFSRKTETAMSKPNAG